MADPSKPTPAPPEGSRPPGSETRRQLVHLAMGGFALLLRFLTAWQALALAVTAFAFNLLVLPRLAPALYRRPGSRLDVGILGYPAVIATLIVLFHDRLDLVAAVWGVLAVGDALATLAGRAVGGPRLPWHADKSWAGTLAYGAGGSVAAVGLMYWTAAGDPGGHGPAWAFLVAPCAVAALSALLEGLPSPLDDNLWVPLVGGAAGFALLAVEPSAAGVAPPWIDRLPMAAAASAAVAGLAWLAGSVRLGGVVAGWAIGTLVYMAAGGAGFAVLVAMFAIGSGATALGYRWKSERLLAEASGGARGAANALANTSVGAACALVGPWTATPTWWTAAMVGAFATATADTVGSEIGKRFGRRALTVPALRVVVPGTPGAVSGSGTLAATVAAAGLATFAWWLGLLGPGETALVTLAAVAGMLVEAGVGGAVAGGGGEGSRHVLNLLNTLLGAALTAALISSLP